jgi:hypothetical protein
MIWENEMKLMRCCHHTNTIDDRIDDNMIRTIETAINRLCRCNIMPNNKDNVTEEEPEQPQARR